jgi:hypothetical protein
MDHQREKNSQDPARKEGERESKKINDPPSAALSCCRERLEGVQKEQKSLLGMDPDGRVSTQEHATDRSKNAQMVGGGPHLCSSSHKRRSTRRRGTGGGAEGWSVELSVQYGWGFWIWRGEGERRRGRSVGSRTTVYLLVSSTSREQ